MYIYSSACAFFVVANLVARGCMRGAPSHQPQCSVVHLTGRSCYVFERCIRQGARWHRILQREDPIYISINMSSQQLFHNDLVQNLRLIIGRETLPKGALRLEIAETLINSNPEQAIEILDWLKSLNVSVALDEFGVSFSSLSYWHRLSIDAIKIDRSLVALSDKERSSAMVLKAVLTIAHELAKDVIAVGVDNEEDLSYVRALGCDFGQGIYYADLMTEREVVNLLNAIARSTRRDDKEQEKEERRAERKAEKERERQEKEREKTTTPANSESRSAVADSGSQDKKAGRPIRRRRNSSENSKSTNGNGAANGASPHEIQQPPSPAEGFRTTSDSQTSRPAFPLGRREK